MRSLLRWLTSLTVRLVRPLLSLGLAAAVVYCRTAPPASSQPYDGATAFLPHSAPAAARPGGPFSPDTPFAASSKIFFTDTGADPLIKRDLSANETLTYRFQQIITGSTATKLAFVLALCCPYVVASAAFYRSLSSESWFNAIYKTYCTLFRTPGSVNRENTVGPAIVLNTVFLYGLFFFAVFLGLITEDIKDGISMLREGHTPVAETGHVVVCNWNESTPALLRQLALAKRKGQHELLGDPVVVLSNRPKSSMDMDVEQEVFQKVTRCRVETRRGVPHKLADLRRVRVNTASTVFIMRPDANTVVSPRGLDIPRIATPPERDALKTATALQVNAMAGNRADQRIIIQDDNQQKAIGYVKKFQHGCSVHPNGAQSIPVQPLDESVMTCLTAQTACRPGLVNVISALFTYKNHDERLRYISDPGVAGRLYGDVRRLISNAVVVGYQQADGGATKLNPSDLDRMQPGDRLLVVSKETKCQFELAPVITDEDGDLARRWMSQRITVSNPPRQVIVLNWVDNPDDIIQHFADFSPPGTEVVFVGQLTHEMPDRVGQVRFRQVHASNHLDFAALCKAGWKKADAVVVGRDPALGDEASDAQLISDIMVLQHHYVAADCSRRLHIVAPILDPDALPVINHVLHDFGQAQSRLLKADPEIRALSELPQTPVVQQDSSAKAPRGGGSGSAVQYSAVDTSADPGDDAILRLKAAQSPEAPALRHKAAPKRIASSPCATPVVDKWKDAAPDQTVIEENLPLANVITAELFLPRDFATGLLVHVAEEPALVDVLQDLFDRQAVQAIYLRSSRYFAINPDSDDAVSFARLAECARARGETAIGIMTREGDLKLAPPFDFEYKFRNGDRIAVFANHVGVRPATNGVK